MKEVNLVMLTSSCNRIKPFFVHSFGNYCLVCQNSMVFLSNHSFLINFYEAKMISMSISANVSFPNSVMLKHLSRLWQQTLPPAVASLIFFNLDNHFPSLAFFIPFSPHNFHLLTTILLLRALILSRGALL